MQDQKGSFMRRMSESKNKPFSAFTRSNFNWPREAIPIQKLTVTPHPFDKPWGSIITLAEGETQQESSRSESIISFQINAKQFKTLYIWDPEEVKEEEIVL